MPVFDPIPFNQKSGEFVQKLMDMYESNTSLRTRTNINDMMSAVPELQVLGGAALPVGSLVEKLMALNKEHPERMKGALLTLKNLIVKRVIKQNPYWEQMDLIPTSELSKMREYDRNILPKWPGRMGEVTKMIENRGIIADAPIIMSLGAREQGAETAKALLGEGNHRVTAAQNLGFPAVPARIFNSGLDPKNYPTKGVPITIPRNERGFLDSSATPSGYGIDYYPLDLVKKALIEHFGMKFKE
jgi:hypothetical protein